MQTCDFLGMVIVKMYKLEQIPCVYYTNGEECSGRVLDLGLNGF